MKVPLLGPLGALAVAGLVFSSNLPLLSLAEGAEAMPARAQSGATPAPISDPLPSGTPVAEPSSSPGLEATPFETPATGTPPAPGASETATPPLVATTSVPTPTLPPGSASPIPQTPTVGASPAVSPSPTPSPGSATSSPTLVSTVPATPTDSITPPTSTPASSATLSPSQTPPAPYPPQTILINELAWAGTIASSSDEWIELQNQTDEAIDLAGWRLTDGGDIKVALGGTIPAFGYFLLERTDDTTIVDLTADQIYTGSMVNGGERLELLDPSGAVVDTANAGGGGWPAGEAGSRRSMERRGGTDLPGDWGTFTGVGGTGHDSAGNAISGTPRRLNSILVPTATPTPFIKPTDLPPQTVLINEIAWSGTLASSSDEWIELHNPGAVSISLTGWKLTDGADISISLSGTIAAYSFYLLERTDDATVSDISADRIYTGSLRDAGEVLQLLGPNGEMIDSANSSGGSWPAGRSSPKASMERRGGTDLRGNWGSFTGYNGNGLDASGDPIRGTPRRTNSLFFPTPTPTGIPSRVVINEVLIRPRYDWEGTGGVTTGDEFIELYNAGPLPVYLKGWWLDDVANGGSKPYDLPGVTISPRGFAVFFHTKTKIALNDTGDTVRLMAPDGRTIDQISYLRVRAANLSYGRLRDGSDNLRYGLWPTPGMPNLLFEEPVAPVVSRFYFGLPCTGQSLTLLTRATRFPAQVAWLREMYFVGCEIQGLVADEGA